MPQKSAKRAEIDASIDRAQERINELEAQLPALTEAESLAWAAYEKADPHANDEEYAAWTKASEERHRVVMANLGYYDWIAALHDQIKALDHPIVAQAEAAKQARLENLRRKTKMAKQTARDRGVPDVYLSENGNFKPGLDARYKSDLVNSVLGEENKNALMTFDPKDAEARLAERDWTPFLEKARASRAEKAAKKEKAAAEKAQAKADKEAAAAQNKAAKAEGGSEVVPDPKPAKSKGGMK